MSWWLWLAAGVLALALLCLTALAALRASTRGRRFLALSTRGKVRFGRTLLSDPGVARPARLALILVVAYLAFPFDLIPDFLPVIGQADDVALVLLAAAFVVFFVPARHLAAALRAGEAYDHTRSTDREEGPARLAGSSLR